MKKDKSLEGRRVRLLHMEGERDMPKGLEGTISFIDDAGTIHVSWDNGRRLGLIDGTDTWELLP